MEICSVIKERAAHRDADGPAEVAHHIEQPAGIFEPFRRQAAESEVVAGRDSKDLGKATEHLRQEELRGTPVMGYETEAPHGQTKGCQAEHHEPARVEFP